MDNNLVNWRNIYILYPFQRSHVRDKVGTKLCRCVGGHLVLVHTLARDFDNALLSGRSLFQIVMYTNVRYVLVLTRHERERNNDSSSFTLLSQDSEKSNGLSLHLSMNHTGTYNKNVDTVNVQRHLFHLLHSPAARLCISHLNICALNRI
jgi:hypothetical protein